MKHTLLVALAAGVMICGSRADAHHSFSATYLEDQHIEIEGELVMFMFRNPHSFVHVMGVSKDDKTATPHRWAVEWGGLTQLARQNVTRDSLKPGDRVIITGNPGRNPADHRVRMQSLVRPKDGFGWKGVVD